MLWWVSCKALPSIQNIRTEYSKYIITPQPNIWNDERGGLQGIFSKRGAATSRRIHETIRESAKSPQYAILADRRLILDTTVRHASQAQAAQHDARQEAAHIFFFHASPTDHSLISKLIPKKKKNQDFIIWNTKPWWNFQLNTKILNKFQALSFIQSPIWDCSSNQ